MIALQSTQTIVTVLRWFIRLLGTGLVVLFVSLYVGEGVLHGFYNPFVQPWPPLLQFLAMMLSLAGFLVAWKEETWGGLMVVAGMGLFYVVQYLDNGLWPGGPVFPAIFGIGFVCLYCGWTSRRSIWHNANGS